MLRRRITTRRTREEVIERANGRCECDMSIHGHEPDACARTPSHLVWCDGALHIDDADSLMFVCSRCYRLIRVARG
jgi:hypothetical protein